VRPGDTVRALQRLIEVSEQSSSTYGRRLVRTRTQVDYTPERDGAPLATHVFTFFNVERSARTGTAAEGTARATAPVYPADQIDQIEADILAERRRGGEPRYIDDVRPGESLGRLTKGPLRVSDVIAWRIGNGPGTRQWGAFRLLSQVRDKQPGFFTKNDIGAWDLVQRLHWEDAWAQRIGRPRAYDEGAMREAWMAQLATDWMGDAGWVCEIDPEIRKFNYMGDLTRITGAVTEVQPASGLVTAAMAGVNQRGEQTCRARVTVRLPSRAGGGPDGGGLPVGLLARTRFGPVAAMLSLIAGRHTIVPFNPMLGDARLADDIRRTPAALILALTGGTRASRRQYWQAKRGSVGTAHPGVDLRVRDAASGQDLDPGAVGLLTVRTPETAGRSADGWVVTNDLASIDRDGFVYIHGRADEAIIPRRVQDRAA
jgi:acyl dehydratase